MIDIGTFKVVSGRIHITDPCYSRDTWCVAFNLLAMNGLWYAVADIHYNPGWGKRPWAIEARHESIHNADDNTLDWQAIDADIGVDSGQCGIFCDSIYPSDKQREKDRNKGMSDPTYFYGKCNQITLRGCPGYPKGYPVDIIDNGGIVTSSGCGDGLYPAEAVFAERQIVAVRINFE